jgi:hypothetical protein
MEGIKTLEDQVMKKYMLLLQVILKDMEIPLKYFKKILDTILFIV